MMRSHSTREGGDGRVNSYNNFTFDAHFDQINPSSNSTTPALSTDLFQTMMSNSSRITRSPPYHPFDSSIAQPPASESSSTTRYADDANLESSSNDDDNSNRSRPSFLSNLVSRWANAFSQVSMPFIGGLLGLEETIGISGFGDTSHPREAPQLLFENVTELELSPSSLTASSSSGGVTREGQVTILAPPELLLTLLLARHMDTADMNLQSDASSMTRRGVYQIDNVAGLVDPTDQSALRGIVNSGRDPMCPICYKTMFTVSSTAPTPPESTLHLGALGDGSSKKSNKSEDDESLGGAEEETVTCDVRMRRTTCDHVFCSDCLEKWLENSTKCPMCMSDLDPEPPGPPHLLPLQQEQQQQQSNEATRLERFVEVLRSMSRTV